MKRTGKASRGEKGNKAEVKEFTNFPCSRLTLPCYKKEATKYLQGKWPRVHLI